jgi:hypothetical protein
VKYETVEVQELDSSIDVVARPQTTRSEGRLPRCMSRAPRQSNSAASAQPATSSASSSAQRDTSSASSGAQRDTSSASSSAQRDTSSASSSAQRDTSSASSSARAQPIHSSTLSAPSISHVFERQSFDDAVWAEPEPDSSSNSESEQSPTDVLNLAESIATKWEQRPKQTQGDMSRLFLETGDSSNTFTLKYSDVPFNPENLNENRWAIRD